MQSCCLDIIVLCIADRYYLLSQLCMEHTIVNTMQARETASLRAMNTDDDKRTRTSTNNPYKKQTAPSKHSGHAAQQRVSMSTSTANSSSSSSRSSSSSSKAAKSVTASSISGTDKAVKPMTERAKRLV
jgi:cobalamin biosynthesis Mg chelatase CobN